MDVTGSLRGDMRGRCCGKLEMESDENCDERRSIENDRVGKSNNYFEP